MAKKAKSNKVTTGKSPAFDFIVKQIERDPNKSYEDIAKAACKAGHEVWPIMYGRALALLGYAGGGKNLARSLKEAS